MCCPEYLRDRGRHDMTLSLDRRRQDTTSNVNNEGVIDIVAQRTTDHEQEPCSRDEMTLRVVLDGH